MWSLKRRFNQTQEDVSYTVLALIQTLAEQVLGEMDVEGLTQELQNRSRARQASRQRVERPPSSLASSIDVVHEHDTRSDTGSMVLSGVSTSYHTNFNEETGSSSNISTSGLQSWVESSGSPDASSDAPRDGEERVLGEATSVVVKTADHHHHGEDVSVADSGPVCGLSHLLVE